MTFILFRLSKYDGLVLNILIRSPTVKLSENAKCFLSSDSSDKNLTTDDFGVLKTFKSATSSLFPAIACAKIVDFICTSSDGVPSAPKIDYNPSISFGGNET